MQMPNATEDLVEEIGHPLMVQVHVYNLAQAGIHQLHHQIPKRRGAQRQEVKPSKWCKGDAEDSQSIHSGTVKN